MKTTIGQDGSSGMRLAAGAALALALNLSVAVSCAESRRTAAEGATSLPPSKQDCGNCHVVTSDATTGALKKQTTELCLECHPERVAPAEHRIGVAPASPPEKLPLVDGKLSCTTCHDPHSNRFGSLLRVPARDLCLLCHRR